jgi:hypothetical protein
MKRVTTAIGGVAVVALLALGACGKKTSEDVTTVSKITMVPSPGSHAEAALTPPPRKAGLWEQKIATARINQTVKMCLDESTDAKLKWWGSQAPRGGRSDCAEERVTPHAGGGWDFHAVCKMGESGTVTSDGSATGDFSSHYKVEVTSVTAGSPMPEANGPHKTSIEATWEGPCPADMKPGDMALPGGMKINTTTGTASGVGGVDMAKLRAQAMSGHMNPGDIAKLRAQAKAMEAASKPSQ